MDVPELVYRPQDSPDNEQLLLIVQCVELLLYCHYESYWRHQQNEIKLLTNAWYHQQFWPLFALIGCDLSAIDTQLCCEKSMLNERRHPKPAKEILNHHPIRISDGALRSPCNTARAFSEFTAVSAVVLARMCGLALLLTAMGVAFTLSKRCKTCEVFSSNSAKPDRIYCNDKIIKLI
ncbi:hypothetical protein GQX74_008393 [Glossina fuscipes]|nr:hypothetical protein GQX74_008393 [Glossina fuscipes]